MKITKSRVPKRPRAGEATPAGRAGGGRAGGPGGAGGRAAPLPQPPPGLQALPLPRTTPSHAKNTPSLYRSLGPTPQAPHPRGAGQPGHVPESFPQRLPAALPCPGEKAGRFWGEREAAPGPGKVACPDPAAAQPLGAPSPVPGAVCPAPLRL